MFCGIAFLCVLVALTPKAADSVDLKRTRTLENSDTPLYQNEGCFSTKTETDGVYLGIFPPNTFSTVDQCAQIARRQDFTEFALFEGGLCRGGHDFQEIYSDQGTSLSCSNGVGGKDSVALYTVTKSGRSCPIESSDKATKRCRKQRQQETAKTRKDYELGQIKYKFDLAHLNRNSSEVYRILQDDALDHHWIDLYNSTIHKNRFLFFKLYFEKQEDDYTRIYNYFVENQLTLVDSENHRYFRFPFQDKNIPFRNLSDLALWRDDELFTDQRLAGNNPMAIQRVSWDPAIHGGVDWTELSGKLNSKFDWERAIQDTIGMDISIAQAIYQGFVYVVHYPLYDGLDPLNDGLDPPFGRLMDAFSPIAIFASKPSRQQRPNRLKPVAIQLNSSPDSPVYTPEDTELWLMAKHVLQAVDFVQTQIVEHLFKLHLFMEPICVCMHRYLAKVHPIHHLLKHHCRGLIGTNSFGFPFLMADDGSINKLMTVGLKGAETMMSRAFKYISWDDIDFLGNIKKRGLGDKEKLPYYPYRDDGELIHDSITNMVNEYVDKYYISHKEVQADNELQKFAHDVSLGSGKVKDFPSTITSKWILKKHLTRFIWALSAQHSAVNYPVDHSGALTLNMPTKLYLDDKAGPGHYGFNNLPRRFTCTSQAALAMTLAAMHYDSLFDFVARLPDKKGRLVVQKYYNYLQGYVTSTIQKRNVKRFDEGHLPYPYFLPAWIANSIHT
ncbi:hypothetical protein ACROYT_G000222 [Oculina patagonica]